MKSHYQAYLIRLQRGRDSDHWRVTLQNAHTGEQMHFADERDLLRYLLQVLAAHSIDVDRLIDSGGDLPD